MNDKPYDIVIIGGGLAGLSILYQLAVRGYRVRLLEARHLCGGSSGACAGRAQIIESESLSYMKLVINGFRCLKELGNRLDYDIEWHQPGHITLIRDDADWKENAVSVERLKQTGMAAEMLDLKQLREMEPCLNIDAFIGGAYSIEGHVNPFKLCMAYTRAAVRCGARIDHHCRVTGFLRTANRINAIKVGEEVIQAGQFILAAGVWTGELAHQIDAYIPVQYTLAEAIVSEALSPLLNCHVGAAGFYDVVHGAVDHSVTLGVGQHLNGTLVVSNAIRQSSHINMQSTPWGMPAIAQNLLKLIPQLKDIRVQRTWCAPSPFLPDYLPAIGWMPQVDNVFVAAGFHLAVPTIPVLSEKIAGMISEEIDDTDLIPFSPQRFHRVETRPE